MKRIALLALAIIILAGCSKEDMMRGRYVASTRIGTINIELLDGGNCVGSLDGGSEDVGTYKIDGDEIRISGVTVEKGYILSKQYKSYYFSYSAPGKIYDKNKFAVEIKNAYGDDTIHCTFVRR